MGSRRMHAGRSGYDVKLARMQYKYQSKLGVKFVLVRCVVFSWICISLDGVSLDSITKY